MRSQPLASLALCCSLLALAGCGAAKSSGTGTSATGTTATTTRPTGPTEPRGGKLGPEGLPVERGTALAPASTTTPGGPVDGIRCPQHEQLAYHIHVHLQVYANGQPRQLPGGIGVVQAVAEPTQYGHLYAATRCYYWLHTHAADGVIHVESPITTIYTLGEFFDEWRQPLNQSTVATASGPVTAYVNGKRWTKSVRAIPLRPHAVIQLDVGRPLAPFHNLSFGRTGLLGRRGAGAPARRRPQEGRGAPAQRTPLASRIGNRSDAGWGGSRRSSGQPGHSGGVGQRRDV